MGINQRLNMFTLQRELSDARIAATRLTEQLRDVQSKHDTVLAVLAAIVRQEQRPWWRRWRSPLDVPVAWLKEKPQWIIRLDPERNGYVHVNAEPPQAEPPQGGSHGSLSRQL